MPPISTAERQMRELDIPQTSSLEVVEVPLTGELILDVFRSFALDGRPATNGLIDNVIGYIRAGIEWYEPTWKSGFKLRVAELRYGVLRDLSDLGASRIVTQYGRREFTGSVHAINADALSIVFHDNSGKVVEAIPVIDRQSLESLVEIEVVEDPNSRQ